MKRIALAILAAFALTLAVAPRLRGQQGPSPTGSSSRARKFDYAVLYSRLDYRLEGHPGINQTAAFHFGRYFGAAVDLGMNFSNNAAKTYGADLSLAGGPRVYPFGQHRATPFGEFLAGAFRQRSIMQVEEQREHYKAVKRVDYRGVGYAGGGVDLAVKSFFGLRVEADYVIHGPAVRVRPGKHVPVRVLAGVTFSL